ncbi:hypothetical protein RKD23_007736 [Streptomyces sp. SAI-170]
MVPLLEVVADGGTGYPDGYPETPPGARRPRVSARDDALVRLAQAAALDGRDEVVLTDELIDALDVGPDEPRLLPHLEVGCGSMQPAWVSCSAGGSGWRS